MQRKTVLRLCLLGAFVLFMAWSLWANTAPELNHADVNSPLLERAFDGFRIAHVSDLHNALMGKENEKLLNLLREAQPDIIAITGDMIDSRRTDMDTALEFAREAVSIAPCFYVPGNHEARISGYESFREDLERLGVTVLEDERTVLERGGGQLVILGLLDPDFVWDGSSVSERISDLKREGEGFLLLLSHRPELFEDYAKSGITLTLSGHAHGGQIRLPLIGGMLAPHQGLFPKYDAGLYSSGESHMMVSRGIGNSAFPLRILNRPEIILITLHCA